MAMNPVLYIRVSTLSQGVVSDHDADVDLTVDFAIEGKRHFGFLQPA